MDETRNGEALIRAADQFRDSRQYANAAEAYGAALDVLPHRRDIRVQYGNMLKETGRLTEAEAAYHTALAQAPDDADTFLQLGHVLKLQGRRGDALQAYLQAATLDPSASAPKQELFHLGHRPTQEQLFREGGPHGGAEELRVIAERVAELGSAVAAIAGSLPDATAQAATPVALYDVFRSVYDIPAPPAPAPELGFTLILCADREPLDILSAQIAAVRAQVHINWVLRVVGSEPARRELVECAAAREPRIAWIQRHEEDNCAAAEWRAASSAETEWLVLLAPGAVLHARALGWFASAAGSTRADAFITDEEVDTGTSCEPSRLRPQLRQVVDYDTLLQANVFGETVAVRCGAYLKISGLPRAASLIIARSLALLAFARDGRVGHIPGPLVRRYEAIPIDPEERQTEHASAVRMHLAAHQQSRAEVGSQTAFRPLSIRWLSREPQAQVAVIIPTRDNGKDLEQAINSMRAKASLPGRLEFLVIDNGSRDESTRTFLASLPARGIKIIRIEEPFNWSRLNNKAAEATDAPLLVFANDDMEMLTEGWDEQLRGLLQRPEIGAVGARLLYPDNTLQHGGILFGWPGSLVIHDGLYENETEPGPGFRWHVTRAVSAVTGAFLATRSELFAAHGRFDEIDLPVAFSDIDYALKLRRSGFKILWTPQITLYHLESKTRGLDHLDPEKNKRNRMERAVMRQRWGAALDAEPSLNPVWHNATLPFRLLAPPSRDLVSSHIQVCAATNPWLRACDAVPGAALY